MPLECSRVTEVHGIQMPSMQELNAGFDCIFYRTFPETIHTLMYDVAEVEVFKKFMPEGTDADNNKSPGNLSIGILVGLFIAQERQRSINHDT